MNDIKEKREQIFNDLKDDVKLLKIGGQRLWRDIVRLVGCMRVPALKLNFNKPWLKWLGILLCVSLLLLTIKMCGGETAADGDSGDKAKRYTFTRKPRVERPDKAHRIANINYRRQFNDLNEKHLSAAKKIGIAPLESRETVDDATRKIVCIDKAEEYVVDKLTHSIPYLVPEAAALLLAIGNNFQDSLVMKHLPPHKLIVTSVLRTKSDVKRLRRSNVNSSANSAHCYGTTFDISYKRFFSENGETTDNSAKLKLVLGEVLRDLKKEGCCYVKHEAKQACFHITARRSPKK